MDPLPVVCIFLPSSWSPLWTHVFCHAKTWFQTVFWKTPSKQKRQISRIQICYHLKKIKQRFKCCSVKLGYKSAFSHSQTYSYTGGSDYLTGAIWTKEQFLTTLTHWADGTVSGAIAQGNFNIPTDSPNNYYNLSHSCTSWKAPLTSWLLHISLSLRCSLTSGARCFSHCVARFTTLLTLASTNNWSKDHTFPSKSALLGLMWIIALSHPTWSWSKLLSASGKSLIVFFFTCIFSSFSEFSSSFCFNSSNTYSKTHHTLVFMLILEMVSTLM